MRWTWLAFSRVSCLRARVRSRRACSGIAGTKLGRMRPWASRSASHVASFTSVLRPGTALTWWALASTSSKSPAKTAQTGFQYTPVASIAMHVTPWPVSHSESRSSSVVVVPKVSTKRTTTPAAPPACVQAPESHDRVPVDVEPGATHVEDVHNGLAFGWRRRGAPDDRSLGCVLRPKGLATVRGAQGAPGPTHTRARGTKTDPTSGAAPLSTMDRLHPARVRLRPVSN